MLPLSALLLSPLPLSVLLSLQPSSPLPLTPQQIQTVLPLTLWTAFQSPQPFRKYFS